MSTPEESPAQRASRLRRERREAKIKEGGSARLDKITSLSGRTPQSVHEDASPSPQLAVSPSPSPVPQNRPSPSPQPNMNMPSDETLQAQQEAFRAMLRQSAPEQGQGQQGQQGDDMEDPTIKLLNSLLGAMPGDPNGPPPGCWCSSWRHAWPRTTRPQPSMLGAATQQPTEREQKATRLWKGLHIVFAIGVAVYLLFIIGASVATFGSPPPKPATAQNPFLIFVTGEVLLTSGRALTSAKQGGIGMVIQLFKDVVRDGSLVLFALGMGAWYTQEWQTVG
ncbi:hypothetical protein N7509_010562 [Penicillium cosmopolitanum]|uniref:GET complex, subunit GET2 n=1 Tax=Penicillium cosmopolitanum TaxID=1131564 RepID=A0A9W9VRH8_9EURO|nr:uncharacterized protein N7509_010562 [Penicillium cosmopolitanum]KAJ5388021.1 hypothetical protein N7509_010562 [Penicillium cosmopolitanum]